MPIRNNSRAGVCARPVRPYASVVTMMVATTVLLFLLAFVGGCGGGDDENPQHSAGAHATKGGGPPGGKGGHGGERPGQGDRPETPPVPVAVDVAITGPIASHYVTNATLEAEKVAEILARVPGVVVSIRGEEGDQVVAGRELLRIEDDEYQLRLRQSKAAAAYEQARFDRLNMMWEQNLISEEEFQEVRTSLNSAQADLELAELNLSYTRVRAPFVGKITRRSVDVGQNVNVGTALFTLADFSPLLARVQVPSKEFRRRKPEQVVELVLDSDQRRLQGTITLVSPVIDPTSGTIKVTVEIQEYPPDTRPGDFAEVRIVTERHERSVLVPKIAVFTDKSEEVLFVAAADSTAERRTVEVGFRDDRHAEILSGLEAGEQVVVKGQRSLKHGAPIEIMEDVLAESSVARTSDS